MQIQLRSPDVRQDGPYKVYVNGASMKKGGAGFAVIQLDERGDTDLTFGTAEDLDRLITAACEAKRMLLAARAPHSFRADSPYSHKCDECGVSKGHHLEPEPALEGTVTAKPADAPYAPVLNGAGRGTAG